MKCKLAKSNIALWIGNDLDEAGVEELRRHLSQCWNCRTHWREMKNSLKVLHEPLCEPTNSTDRSIWPGLSVRLAACDAKILRQVRFNGWFAGSAVAAACCVLVAFGVTYQSPSSPWSAGLSGESVPDSFPILHPKNGRRSTSPEDDEPMRRGAFWYYTDDGTFRRAPDSPSKPRPSKQNLRKRRLSADGSLLPF